MANIFLVSHTLLFDFPHGKSNSSLQVVTFPWIVSGYNFNIMNTLHEFEKTCSTFQITVSKLPVKADKIYIEDVYINDA